MTKRIALALALAFATLTVAAPAYACNGDCECAKKAAAGKKDGDTKQGEKKPAGKTSALTTPSAAQLAAGEAPKKCECEKGGKGCTCPKGECKCANCGQGEKKGA